jgi:HAD superfamily hydrolase (TIGR01549 family)
MRVRAVFLDVGETLVDERRYWGELARLAGVEPQALIAALGVAIARGEEHTSLWAHLGLERPRAADALCYEVGDLYPDALPCLTALRRAGYLVGLAGNQNETLEAWTRETLPADVYGSSASWGVRKPDERFFERIVEEARMSPPEIAYVGDRADNDARPALAAGLAAVHVRRGPWGRLQESPAGAIAVASLSEVVTALAAFRR